MTAEWALTILMYIIGGYVCFKLGYMLAERRFKDMFVSLVTNNMDELERLHECLVEDEE